MSGAVETMGKALLRRSPSRGGGEGASGSSSSSAASTKSASARSPLDYSLRFPTASARRLAKDPVVILLGWAGAVDAHLQKYTEIYFDEGCISLRWTLPAVLSFHGTRAEVEAAGAELGRMLEELELFAGHPLLFHIFSNNGSTALAALMRAMRERPSNAAFQSAIRGLIFDSGPAWPLPLWNVASAYAATLCPPRASPFLRSAVFWGAYAAIGLSRVWSWLSQRLLARPRPPSAYEELAESLVVQRTPSLFLYSQTDEICPSTKIEAFMGRLERAGASVKAGRFPDSAHVQHYRRYPVQYTAYVARFLHKVVAFESSGASSGGASSGGGDEAAGTVAYNPNRSIKLSNLAKGLSKRTYQLDVGAFLRNHSGVPYADILVYEGTAEVLVLYGSAEQAKSAYDELRAKQPPLVLRGRLVHFSLMG